MRLMKVPDSVRQEQRRMALAVETDGLHQVYRCFNCSRIVTKINILEARARQEAAVCFCGSAKIQPTNTSLWEELTSIKMLKMVIAVYTKQLAPPPLPPTVEVQKQTDRVAHEAMRVQERMAVEAVSRLP